jgi:hypothetical protein
LGSDLEQIATIADGLVVIDFGVANSITERFAHVHDRPPQPGRNPVTIPKRL